MQLHCVLFSLQSSTMSLSVSNIMQLAFTGNNRAVSYVGLPLLMRSGRLLMVALLER